MDAPLEHAAELAARTGEGNAYGLGFGSTNVGVWRMSVALESRDVTQAASVAEGLRPELLPAAARRAGPGNPTDRVQFCRPRAPADRPLMMVTTLHEKPSGIPCKACATLRFDHAMAEVPGQIHPPLNDDSEPNDDEPDPQAWITYVGDCGHHRVMSTQPTSDHAPTATHPNPNHEPRTEPLPTATDPADNRPGYSTTGAVTPVASRVVRAGVITRFSNRGGGGVVCGWGR